MIEGRQQIFYGVAISPGIAIGSAYFYSAIEETIAEVSIESKEIEPEVARYQSALHASCRDLKKMRKACLKEGSEGAAQILEAHLAMLQDPLLISEIKAQIRSSHKNTETVFESVIGEYKVRLEQTKDDVFKERLKDIVDVSRRMLRHLHSFGNISLKSICPNAIVFARDLMPSDTVEANMCNVCGFVTEKGGPSSHAAIIARAKGLPYIANIDQDLIKAFAPEMVIIDGIEGKVIINPESDLLDYYQKAKARLEENYLQMQSKALLSAVTKDKQPIIICGNIDGPEDIDEAFLQQACGVGLYRSEYLLLKRGRFLSEDEQFAVYLEMAKKLEPRPFVIRLFDVGSDKEFLDHKTGQCSVFDNCRAIRMLLRNPDILKAQLKAIFRAAIIGNVQILIPFVSDISEIVQLKKIMEEAGKELKEAAATYRTDLPLGCMIEVPASAILCDLFVKEVDFFSIGTNDLMQYVLAFDRMESSSFSNLSVLRLIETVASVAAAHDKRLILCGEMAADPALTATLLGLGLRELSLSLRHIPHIKETISQIDTRQARKAALKALSRVQ